MAGCHADLIALTQEVCKKCAASEVELFLPISPIPLTYKETQNCGNELTMKTISGTSLLTYHKAVLL